MDSGPIPVSFLWILVIPVSFWRIPVPFLRIPPESGDSCRNLWGMYKYSPVSNSQTYWVTSRFLFFSPLIFLEDSVASCNIGIDLCDRDYILDPGSVNDWRTSWGTKNFSTLEGSMKMRRLWSVIQKNSLGCQGFLCPQRLNDLWW